MKTPFQSFFLSLLSLVLLSVIGGLSFLIFDRMVLEGKYTNPYDKGKVIQNLGVELNEKMKELNQAHHQIVDVEAKLENATRTLNDIPIQQLNAAVSNAAGPDKDIIFQSGRLTFREQTFFKSGSNELTPSAKAGLNRIVPTLLTLSQTVKFPWVLRIEGHTDPQREPASYGYRSNWRLGFERAHNVLEYFISKGIDAKHLYIVSHSSYHPGPYPNNRRVSLTFDYSL